MWGEDEDQLSGGSCGLNGRQGERRESIDSPNRENRGVHRREEEPQGTGMSSCVDPGLFPLLG